MNSEKEMVFFLKLHYIIYKWSKEAIANGIEDKLINGLSFKLNPGASYVVGRSFGYEINSYRPDRRQLA